MDRSTSFRRVMTRLPDATVVSFDRRGYADSVGTRPSDVFDRQVDDLVEVLAGRLAVVVGHSFGGDVVLATCQRHPELFEAAMVYEPPQPWLNTRPGKSAGSWAMAHAGEDPGEAAEIFMRRMIGDARWERLPETVRQQRRAEGAALVADLTSLRAAPPPFEPSAISIPVVCGYGTRSKDHHRQDTRTLASQLPGGELHAIPGCDHGAHLSHPNEFAALIRRAIDLR
jgi:pimeloyl-ACP methyl ester carboxylesterase